MTYFELFGLPPHLHLDLAALEKAFYAQSRKLHPDRFAARPQSEQDDALAASSALTTESTTADAAIANTSDSSTVGTKYATCTGNSTASIPR